MELGPNVTVLEDGPNKTYLVGTAHISERSVQEVRQTIEAVRPDSVCVELCQTRYDAIMDDDRWKKLDIFQVLKQKKVLFVLANLALSAYQRKLGEKLGVKPGAELVEAIQAADDVGAELVLVDRDIQATLKRTWGNLSFFNKIKVATALTGSVGSDEEITEEDLERLKDKDNISEMMKAFAEELPQVKEPLIDERDHFLISAIEDAPGETKVAVVGAGHVEGMIAHRGKGADRVALSEIPPRSKAWGFIKWIIPTLILIAFYWGYQNRPDGTLYQLIMAWVIPNAIGAAVMTAIAGAKAISVVTATVASPITSLNPTIGAGMVVGVVEAWLRKPKVEDAERLAEDVTSLKGMYRNPFSRVLLVALFATFGSAAGAWVGASVVVSQLSVSEPTIQYFKGVAELRPADQKNSAGQVRRVLRKTTTDRAKSRILEMTYFGMERQDLLMERKNETSTFHVSSQSGDIGGTITFEGPEWAWNSWTYEMVMRDRTSLVGKGSFKNDAYRTQISTKDPTGKTIVLIDEKLSPITAAEFKEAMSRLTK